MKRLLWALVLVLACAPAWGEVIQLRQADGTYTEAGGTGDALKTTGGGGGGGTEFAEDAAHSSGALGTLMLGVRQDADTSPVSATGDYHAPIFDNAGNLKVNIKAGAGSGGTALADDAAFTAGTTNFTPVGCLADMTSPDSVDENDGGACRMSLNRNIFIQIRDGANNERGLAVSAGGNISVDTVTTVTAVTAISNALPAGNNNIGDVDIASIVPGTGATNLGKAEDAAHSSGDVGVSILCVRDDTLDVRSGAENDYEPCHTDATGRIRTEAIVSDGSGALNVICDSGCGSGTQYAEDTAHASGDQVSMAGVVQQSADAALSSDGDRSVLQVDANGYLKVNIKAGAGSGGTAIADDAAFTAGTTNVTPAGAMFDDAAPDSVNEGDAGVVRMSANRNLYSTLRDAAGNERGANVNASNELNTSANTELPTAAALADDTANPTVPGVGSYNMCWDGATWDRCAKSTAGNGTVDSATQRVTLASDSTGNIATIGTSVTPGTGATNLGKAEDAAHSSGDVGVAILCVRDDTLDARSGAENDYEPCHTDASGRVHTSDNLASVAGNTISTGVGVAGTGTQRVTVAHDSDVCNAKNTLSVAIDTATSGNVELVALTSAQTIYVCDFTIIADGTVGVQLIYGTGSACATGETNLTGVMSLVANAGWTQSYGGRLKTAEANAFCIELSAAVQVSGVVTYRKAATF